MSRFNADCRLLSAQCTILSGDLLSGYIFSFCCVETFHLLAALAPVFPPTNLSVWKRQSFDTERSDWTQIPLKAKARFFHFTQISSRFAEIQA